MSCFRQTASGIEIFVRLTPRAGADRIDGTVADAEGTQRLALRVRAVPEKGKANAALLRLLADTLGVPLKAVSVRSGQTSRLKTVAAEGDPTLLAGRLEAAAGPPP